MTERRYVILTDVDADEVYSLDDARETARTDAKDTEGPVYIAELLETFVQADPPIVAGPFDGIHDNDYHGPSD